MPNSNPERELRKEVSDLKKMVKEQGVDITAYEDRKDQAAQLERKNDAMSMTLIALADGLIQKIENYWLEKKEIDFNTKLSLNDLYYIKETLGGRLPVMNESEMYFEEMNNEVKQHPEKRIFFMNMRGEKKISPEEKRESKKNFERLKTFEVAMRPFLKSEGYGTGWEGETLTITTKPYGNIGGRVEIEKIAGKNVMMLNHGEVGQLILDDKNPKEAAKKISEKIVEDNKNW